MNAEKQASLVRHDDGIDQEMKSVIYNNNLYNNVFRYN